MKTRMMTSAALTAALLSGGHALAAPATLSIQTAAFVQSMGTPGTTYALQAARTLDASDWRTLDGATADETGSVEFLHRPSDAAQHFYRVVEVPVVDVGASWTGPLDRPLTRYRLTEDLSRAGDALTITADRVILDLNGRTISGDRTGTAIKVVGASGVLIRGGSVTGFVKGVFLEQAAHAYVKDLTIRGIGATNDNWGIHATNSTGLHLEGCEVSETHNPAKLEAVTQSEVNHCTMDRNDKGIFLSAGSTGNRVHHNRVTGSPAQSGIIANEQSNGNEFYANRCEGNRVGIQIDLADGNLIRDNTANANGWGGIWIRRGANNVVRHNTTLRNGTPTFVRWGILVGFPKAFGGPLYATGTLVEDNTALDNADSHATYGAYQIDLFDNSLWDKTACENTWRNNVFVKDNEKNGDYGPAAGCIR